MSSVATGRGAVGHRSRGMSRTPDRRNGSAARNSSRPRRLRWGRRQRSRRRRSSRCRNKYCRNRCRRNSQVRSHNTGTAVGCVSPKGCPGCNRARPPATAVISPATIPVSTAVAGGPSAVPRGCCADRARSCRSKACRWPTGDVRATVERRGTAHPHSHRGPAAHAGTAATTPPGRETCAWCRHNQCKRSHTAQKFRIRHLNSPSQGTALTPAQGRTFLHRATNAREREGCSARPGIGTENLCFTGQLPRLMASEP